MRRAKRIKKKAARRYFKLVLGIVIPLMVLILGFAVFRLNTRFWNGRDKISVVSLDLTGNIAVEVHDPVLDEVTKLIIPGETEVAVSGNLGTLRIKNVWQLGVNEKMEGKLLAETITKNFHFPVFLWRGPEGETNIPFGDRLLIWYFEKRTKNLQKSEIDLGKSQYLKKQILKDGEAGYKLMGDMSERLTVYFQDNDFSTNSPKVYIKDKTGVFGVADNVGKVAEVLGGKVVTIERGQEDDSDCSVSGNLSKKISQIFGCKVEKGTNNFDIEISLGSRFARRH